MKQRSGWVWLGYGVGWLLLAGLAALTAWQAHITTIYLGALLINNPSLRPSGWSSSTLVGISKLSVLAWGSLWLILVYYLEYQLRESLADRRLLVQCGRFALALLAGFIVAYGLTLL